MPSDWMLPALTLGAFGLVLLARPILAQAGRLTGIPWQFYRIAVNPRLRRNHALEHATLNVLTQRHGLPRLNGAAVESGFVLRGWVNPAEIASAAREGLARLQAGERALAYHPRCGTSLATGELLTWGALVLGVMYAGRFTAGAILVTVGLSWLLSPLAGWIVQRSLTTSPDVSGLSISGVAYTPLALRSRSQPTSGPEGTVAGQVVVMVESGGGGGRPDLRSAPASVRRFPGRPR